MFPRFMCDPHSRQRHCTTRSLCIFRIPCSARCSGTPSSVTVRPQIDPSSDTHSHRIDDARDIRPSGIGDPGRRPTGTSLMVESGPKACHESFGKQACRIDHNAHMAGVWWHRRDRVASGSPSWPVVGHLMSHRAVVSARCNIVRDHIRLGWRMGSLRQNKICRAHSRLQ